jgi:hypothetical protein
MLLISLTLHMNSQLWWVHATLFPTTCWIMIMCELTLAVSHPPQEKYRWFKRSHTSRSSIRSRWRLPVDFLAPRMDFRSCYIYLLFFVSLPLCNKYSDYCDIYLYTLCYYICCLLWRMYEIHPALSLKARVWQGANLGRHPTTLMDRPVHRRTSPAAHLDESYVLSVETSELVLNIYVCVRNFRHLSRHFDLWDLCSWYLCLCSELGYLCLCWIFMSVMKSVMYICDICDVSFVCLDGIEKTNKKCILVTLPSVSAIALGREAIPGHRYSFFAECCGPGTRQRGKLCRVPPRALGKDPDKGTRWWSLCRVQVGRHSAKW